MGGSGAELRPGLLITPSIRLVRMLGQGGMGSVWVAEHLRLHTEVVVKFMSAEYAFNAEALQRFEREATLAAQAKSPHVVQVFDHGVSPQGLPYIAMELLEGEDLARRIQHQGRIPPLVFAEWLRQACSGLSRAHSKGIVHRDVKPENIFLCDDDGSVVVKVLDFGIAKSDAPSSSFSGTRTGAMMGTAYYMSPEQTMGSKHVDHRTDLWALGVVTYFALTGVRPFDGDAIGALVLAITQQPITPPSRHNPDLGSSVDVWMAKALSRDLASRFSSAKEMAEAFLAAVRGSEPTALAAELRPSTPAGELQVPARSHDFSANTMSPSVRTGDAPTEGEPVQLPPKRRRGLGLLVAALGIPGVAAATWLLRSPAPANEADSAARASVASTVVATQAPKAVSLAPEAAPRPQQSAPPVPLVAPAAITPAPAVAAPARAPSRSAAASRPVEPPPPAAATVAKEAPPAEPPVAPKPSTIKPVPTSKSPLRMAIE